ncbi:MAG: sensor histidine kinase [Proteobacteria bacterium]|nr:sensor histidine kinase [Pseudomonadota bacterium]
MLGAGVGGSLVGRLIWLAAIWSLAALIATGAALTSFFQNSALETFQAGVFEVVNGLYGQTKVDKDGKVLPPQTTDLRATQAYSGSYWEIAEPAPGGIASVIRSKSLFDKELAGPPGGVKALDSRLGKPIYYDTTGPDATGASNAPMRAVALMAKMPNQKYLIFMAAQDRRPVDKAARRFTVLTAFALICLGLGVVLAVMLQVRFGLRPLFDLGREIAEVRTGRRQRLEGTYPREIAPLAGQVNALLDHNQEVVERQRTHVGNLAHALKTPLAVITSEASTQPGALAEVVTRQAGLMREQVDHHLRRARAAARAQSAGERTLIEPAIDELARMIERVFEEKGVLIDWDIEENLAFLGERQDFLEVAGNLLENAGKWSRKHIDVTAARSRPGFLAFTVQDDGPGLPEDQRAEVLKRGARLDESAPGSGLGLSIVDELARAYGGSVSLAKGELGGLKVSVELPVAES